MTLTTTKSTISNLPNGLHELHIKGRFYHPHWLAFLLSGLSQLNISTVAGTALSKEQQEWDARLVLDFGKSNSNPDRVDYVTLAETRTTLRSSTIQLSTFKVSPRASGTIEVHLEGRDQLGFLGAFLTRVSLLGLFPSEVKIETNAGYISDRIVLTGLAGAPPDEIAVQSLEAMLHDLRI